MALFSVMAIIAALAIIGASAFVLASTDLGIARNHRNEMTALYQADAGSQYIKTQIEAALVAGTLTLTNTAIASLDVNYSAPSGFSFDTVTNITRMPNGCFYFAVSGRASNAMARVTVAFRQQRAMNMGMFGTYALDLKAGGSTYSYYSSQLPGFPIASNSTHQGDIGTDGSVITHNGTFVDGSLLLGATEGGVTATWSDPGAGSEITGTAGNQVGYVNPDPLGALTPTGTLYTAFQTYSTVNNNANAIPPIIGNKINLGNSAVMTLPSGNYYLSSLNMRNSSQLIIKATNGPVNIYLTGGANFGNGSVVNTNAPTSFNMYSNYVNPGNGSSDILVNNSGAFSGLIYAPYANVQINNSGDFYGVAWGGVVQQNNSGNVYVDLDMMNKFMLKKIQFVAWKQNRGSG
jgi:hypothetical protein